MYMYLGYICMSLAICLKAIAVYIHRKSGTLVMLVWLCVCMCDVYACVVCVCVCVCVHAACVHACMRIACTYVKSVELVYTASNFLPPLVWTYVIDQAW